MTPFMSGKGKTKEERKRAMCIGAKMCSGKAQTETEAEQICINQPPKEPKARKQRGTIDAAKLAGCVASSLDLDGLTVDNAPARLETAITHCSTGAKGSPDSFNRFMKNCLKQAGGSLKTYQHDMKACQAEWAKTQGA